MFVIACQARFRIAGAQSLKDKRRIVRSAVERLQSRFNAAVSEVADHDVWQLACLGLAVVSRYEADGRDVMAHMLRHVEAHGGLELIEADVTVC